MADPHPPSLPQPNPQPPPPPQPFPQPSPTLAKKSYSSIVQHPIASHFPHDPDRAAKKSFHNEDLPQMGTATTHKGDPAIQGHQQVPSASVEISDEDNFNYDDPIIAELFDKDWDKELNKQGKSPSDKAAHFDLTSSKNGTSPNREPQPAQTPKHSRQLLFTPAWSFEEGESDIMETQIEGSGTLYKGDTSTYRTTESQETEAVGEEEEDSTPLFNRFQNLQNLEEEDPPMHAQPNLTHTTHSTEGKEARGIEQHNTNIINSATEQGSYDQSQTTTPIDIQDQLLLDSASSLKHKRNKSQEDLHIQESTKNCKQG
ncbi:hypothetical protein Salat_1861600 [Sesamum alatum]|uniref:Uncharacterized protein n=1 Tax=Sesamum alatum TaxID=300844 RepID=A0AAE1Y402_9LAMI|nr:hypothetical protein Salat_1861600 [Sesamum alatum]